MLDVLIPLAVFPRIKCIRIPAINLEERLWPLLVNGLPEVQVKQLKIHLDLVVGLDSRILANKTNGLLCSLRTVGHVNNPPQVMASMINSTHIYCLKESGVVYSLVGYTSDVGTPLW